MLEGYTILNFTTLSLLDSSQIQRLIFNLDTMHHSRKTDLVGIACTILVEQTYLGRKILILCWKWFSIESFPRITEGNVVSEHSCWNEKPQINVCLGLRIAPNECLYLRFTHCYECLQCVVLLNLRIYYTDDVGFLGLWLIPLTYTYWNGKMFSQVYALLLERLGSIFWYGCFLFLSK